MPVCFVKLILEVTSEDQTEELAARGPKRH